MKFLSVVVAAFGLIAAGVWFRVGDPLVLLLAAFSLGCAAATFQSQTLSTFLKIFVAIFATENVVFGSAYLIGKLGLWPASLDDYQLPESLPLTMAIFAMLVFGISHFGVVRSIMGIADRYFQTDHKGTTRIWPLPAYAALERRIATAMIVFLVLVNQAEVAIEVRLSFFSRDWFNAIQTKDQPAFWYQLFSVFLPWAAIFVTISVIEYVVTSMLLIRWRRWLTDHYISLWLNGHTHYRIALMGGEADNPDQRIAEDVNRFIGGSGTGIYSISIDLIATLSSLVSFSILLWGLSANFTLPGLDIAVPGFLFWTALVYAAFGTLVTHLIGRPLVALFFNQQKYEANFRFGLARLREYSEQVALLKGEATEHSLLLSRFGDLMTNFLRIVNRRKWLTAFTVSYRQVSPFIPYIVAAPFYFAGKITLGIMTQTARAFGSVENGLNYVVTSYVNLAEFKAVLDRLTGFDHVIGAAKALGNSPPRIDLTAAAGSSIAVSTLQLVLPDQRILVTDVNLTFAQGQSVIVSGPSGSGKSTLFRAISGIWPLGHGRIDIPGGARMMLLPQRPYIQIGSLRAAICYPGSDGLYSDDAIRAALHHAALPMLADDLDAEENWSQRLSGGEQQRLAIARALLARPDWLFLDEATAALDENTEAALYQMLARELPGTTVVSIGHRSTLNFFHQRRIVLVAGPDGLFAPGEAA